MWRVRAFNDQAWIDLSGVGESEVAEAPTTAAVRLLAQRLLSNYPHLLDHLEEELHSGSEASTVNGRRDAIELWNRDAEREAREYNWNSSGRVEALEEALALYPEGTEYGDKSAVPTTLAWHDHTFIIIPIFQNSQQIEVEYSPSLRDENRIERLRHRYATPEHELETIFDWRGYFGRESAAIDGWIKMRKRGHGYAASFLGTFGFVVGHVVRRLTRSQPTLERDPTAKNRLIQMSDLYPHIANYCPDISRINPAQRDRAVVFVHGTMSCGLQGLKDFFRPSTDEPIYRYEHDTFLSLDANGKELVELIESNVHSKKLLLIGHSRGGLVARFVADALVRKGYSGDVKVFTFGTPHLGTPLIAMGGEVLNLLYKLSGDLIGVVPHLTLLAKAYSFLIKSPTLPPGIAVMAENSGTLSTMNDYGDSGRVWCWGSAFDIGKKSSGFGIVTTGTLLGTMSGIAHDLIVPTHSALGFGIPQQVLECSHTQYFQQPMVQEAIRNINSVSGPQYGPVLKLNIPQKKVDPGSAKTGLAGFPDLVEEL